MDTQLIQCLLASRKLRIPQILGDLQNRLIVIFKMQRQEREPDYLQLLTAIGN